MYVSYSGLYKEHWLAEVSITFDTSQKRSQQAATAVAIVVGLEGTLSLYTILYCVCIWIIVVVRYRLLYVGNYTLKHKQNKMNMKFLLSALVTMCLCKLVELRLKVKQRVRNHYDQHLLYKNVIIPTNWQTDERYEFHWQGKTINMHF